MYMSMCVCAHVCICPCVYIYPGVYIPMCVYAHMCTCPCECSVCQDRKRAADPLWLELQLVVSCLELTGVLWYTLLNTEQLSGSFTLEQQSKHRRSNFPLESQLSASVNSLFWLHLASHPCGGLNQLGPPVSGTVWKALGGAALLE